VIVPKDATSALDPFDLESSLRQTAFLFNGAITQSNTIMTAYVPGAGVPLGRLEAGKKLSAWANLP